VFGGSGYTGLDWTEGFIAMLIAEASKHKISSS